MATYPSGLLVKADVINDVDVYDQNDHNILKGEIIALETAIGTNPQGTRTDFVERFNAMHNPSGYLISSAGVPQPTAPGFLWADSAAGVLKYILTDNTIQTVGQNFSNVIYRDSPGFLHSSEGVYGYVGSATGTSPVIMAPTNPYFGRYCWSFTATTTWTKMRPAIYWTKITGVNTLKVNANWWCTDEQWSMLSFGVGASTVASATYQSSSPHLEILSYDVSGLTSGTTYAFDFKSRKESSTSGVFLGNVNIFGQ